MLIKVPVLGSDGTAAFVWLNPAFIVVVTEAGGNGSVIAVTDFPNRRLIEATITAQAVAQLVYEARHNL